MQTQTQLLTPTPWLPPDLQGDDAAKALYLGSLNGTKTGRFDGSKENRSAEPLNYAPMLVEWDDKNMKQVEQAKKKYQQARREGREILDLDGNPVEFFRPNLLGFQITGKALKEGEFSLRILNEKGDETIIWNSHDQEQVEEAAKKFKEYMDKGWTPYAISPDGTDKRKITQFNSELLEVTFEEPGTGKKWTEKLASFVKNFAPVQVQMLPKTYPG